MDIAVDAFLFHRHHIDCGENYLFAKMCFMHASDVSLKIESSYSASTWIDILGMGII